MVGRGLGLGLGGWGVGVEVGARAKVRPTTNLHEAHLARVLEKEREELDLG
jgi:hypothetical protein